MKRFTHVFDIILQVRLKGALSICQISVCTERHFCLILSIHSQYSSISRMVFVLTGFRCCDIYCMNNIHKTPKNKQIFAICPRSHLKGVENDKE